MSNQGLNRLRGSVSFCIGGIQLTAEPMASEPIEIGNKWSHPITVSFTLNREKSEEIRRWAEIQQLQHLDGDER